MNSQQSILNSALSNFDQAKELIGNDIDRELLNKMRLPKERIELTLSPQMRNGRLSTYRAFIVRHSDALGPAKGGIRMTPDVTLDDVTGLAMEMTWKCALIGTPFGGGKAGIVANVPGLNQFDKETIIRSFARNARRHIGPLIYVPAPDMGTSGDDMGYLKDTISYSVGQATTQGCYVTGKPVILGGIPGRREATGRGVVIATLEALKLLNLDPAKSTYVIQGFGNVGSVAAQELHALGGRIIAVGDLTGAVHDPHGLDIPVLAEYVQRTGGIRDFPKGETTDSAELMKIPCDVLIPAAAASQINASNAPHVQAHLIAEGANSPITPEGDEILARRDVFIIPDILCNAGGVFVSYLEFTQETQQEQMIEAEVNQRLRQRMTEKFGQVHALSQERNLSMRQAAMVLAIKTVGEALTARGMLP